MKKFITLCCFLACYFIGLGQELTKADYARAVSFLWPNLANKKVFNLSLQPAWFPDSTGFSFVTYSSSDKVFNKVEFKNMKIVPLFDHERLARLLNDSLKTTVKATALPFDFARYINKSTIEFNVQGKAYQLDINKWILKPRKRENENDLESKSPDNKWIAFSKDHNLYI
ncbi:MAG: S9 family peptidase, partial [Pedobacter sp.]